MFGHSHICRPSFQINPLNVRNFQQHHLQYQRSRSCCEHWWLILNGNYCSKLWSNHLARERFLGPNPENMNGLRSWFWARSESLVITYTGRKLVVDLGQTRCFAPVQPVCQRKTKKCQCKHVYCKLHKSAKCCVSWSHWVSRSGTVTCIGFRRFCKCQTAL